MDFHERLIDSTFSQSFQSQFQEIAKGTETIVRIMVHFISTDWIYQMLCTVVVERKGVGPGKDGSRSSCFGDIRSASPPNPFRGDNIEIGFPVPKKIAGKDNIQAGEMPAGKIATCVHIGPYSDIAPAYTALSEWIKANGYEATGVAYEMYLNDPSQTPPQELMTRIVFPLQTS